MDRKAPVFATLGCRLNAYETEAMRDWPTPRGWATRSSSTPAP